MRRRVQVQNFRAAAVDQTMDDPTPTISPHAYDFQDLGGIVAMVLDGEILHWNKDVPGSWVGPHTLAAVGSYVSSLCKSLPGVYRLIALDDTGAPATLQRMCGTDSTGTLYIGMEGRTFSDRSRLTKLVRSLRPPRGHGRGVFIHNREHHAGYRLRRHQILSQKFPPEKLALTWCYSNQPALAEAALLDIYFDSFGDTPPLNRR
jgi:hypothetical protein